MDYDECSIDLGCVSGRHLDTLILCLSTYPVQAGTVSELLTYFERKKHDCPYSL